MGEEIKLGDKVKDNQTGYEGIATAKWIEMSGEIQYRLENALYQLPILKRRSYGDNSDA